MLHVGTAGWAIRREHQDSFPGEGSHLTRYAGRLNAVEINSSFYRPHRAATYARWARNTPDGFSFAVKMPRAITHEARLTGGPLDRFLDESSALGPKLGCILIQLPPGLAFEPADLFDRLRDRYAGMAALEPRHPSWFTRKAEAMLVRFRIARVAVDPIPAKMDTASGAAEPGGFAGLRYWRLHGSPQIYRSNYGDDVLHELAQRLAADAPRKDVWCIFDNTALGHAATNALTLRRIVRGGE